MLKPSHLLAFAETRIARNDVGPAVADIQRRIEKTEPYAGDQHRGDRHQYQWSAVRMEADNDRSALILAKQLLDPLE